ncbi:MAG: hypothetical protein IH957_09810 [Chloroflexi bacterium]|nr:hypothetical protein [Chloroflexota bacterium]
MTSKIAPRDKIDSLGSDQVSVLLRNLRLHRQLLEAAHQDAKRLASFRTPPCYLVDYELLHTYMYESQARAEALVEVQHLFSQSDILFIVGYGTSLEVIHRIRVLSGLDVTGVDEKDAFFELLYSDKSPLAKLRFDPETSLKMLIENSPHHVEALDRLEKLLDQDNFIDISQIEQETGQEVIDQHAFEAALSVLNSVRPNRNQTYPNVADAVNFSTVVSLRNLARKGTFKSFPFLLTNTRPLLDESIWAEDPLSESWGFEAKVSRRPLTSVYTHLASGITENPDSVADHTARLIQMSSAIELNLRLSRGYRTPVQAIQNYEWENIIAVRRIEPDLAEQINYLSEFISDPLISETQRIYDNTLREIAIRRELRGSSSRIESPRRLFDVILHISRAVSSPTTLEVVWDKVIVKVEEKHPSFTRRTYADASKSGLPYVEVETHEEGYVVLNWPTNNSIEDLLTSFMWALGRHHESEATLAVGTEPHDDNSVQLFEIELPVTLGEIRSHISEPITWIRLGGKEFDLYCDVLTRAEITPRVGLFAKNPNQSHVIELYSATSARFLFRSLLQRILAENSIGEQRESRV